MSFPGLGPPPVAPPRAPLGPPYSPSAILNLNQTRNMSGSSLTDALILLSGAYLSVVQPAPGPPRVGLYTILPKAGGDFLKEITNPFEEKRKFHTYRKYRNIASSYDLSSAYSRSEYNPKELLDILCNKMFPRNTITVFYLNNPEGLYKYRKPTVEYLPQIISSLGLPIISYDTQFSFNRRAPLSIQLAPTMGQMMDVLFAFLKKYNWTDFSFLCTMSKGCLDEIAAIRLKVEESHRRPVTTIYGVEMFSFNLLSYVNFTDGQDRQEVEEKLVHEMDRDTRVILIHGGGQEVKNILDIAKELGLAGKEYVWILTGASITITKQISKSYPLGSFIIGFDSDRSDMKGVVEKALDVWMQALDSLAESPEMEEVDFETGFSCTGNRIGSDGGNGGDGGGGGSGDKQGNHTAQHYASAMRWKYGEVLYKHILKSKVSKTIEFDEHGILKGNPFWIRNIQIASQGSRRVHYSAAGHSTRGRTGYEPPRRERPSGSPVGRGRSSGSPVDRGRSQSGRGPPSSGLSRGRDRSSGITPGRDPSSRIPSSRDRSSRLPIGGRNRQTGNSRGNQRERTSGDLYSRDRESRRPSSRPSQLSAKRLRNSSALRSYRGRPQSDDNHGDKTSTSRADVERTEVEIFQTTAEPLEGEDHFVVGDSNPPPKDVIVSDDTEYYSEEKKPDTSPSGGSILFGWRNAEKSGSVSPRGGKGRSKRSYEPIHIAKKIAEWDGHHLTISSITWPGGASKPPKGKPEKYVLRVATWHEDPHVKFVDPDNTTGECDSHSLPCTVNVRDSKTHAATNETRDMCCTGLCMDLLKRLSEELHIDVDLTEAREGSYGSALDQNRTRWNGLMGMLTRKEADLAMAAMAITPERSAAVEFSMPFLQTGITIIVAIRAGVISPTAFLEPYDYLSWTLILVFSVHATGTSIFIFEWLSPYGLDHGKTPLSVHKFSLFRSFWLIWAMLFGASVSTDMPRGCASRFLANIWALFAVVFCASYTANLAAFMITKDDFYDLSGIQDWRLRYPHHRQPPFKFATITNSSTDTNIFKNYPQIHSFMSAYGQYDVKEAIDSLKGQEIQAFIYDSTTLEYEVGKDDGCKLKTVGKRIAETGYGVAFPKKSQWTKKFNVALLRLQEDGEIERIQKFWLAGACHKKKEGVGVSSHTLGILNFTSAFILLGGGIIVGAILLTLEHMYFRFGRKQLKKIDKYGCCSLVSLSMGQSLTFERSVMEAIDFHKQHKCKDPICETQLWKVKHELDLALLKIAQLRKQIAYSSTGQAMDENVVIPPAQATGGEDTSGGNFRNGASAPRRRRQNKTDESRNNATTKPLLHSDEAGDSDTNDSERGNNYSLLGDNVNGHNAKPKTTPQDLYHSAPEVKPAVKPRPPAKRPHERSNNVTTPSSDSPYVFPQTNENQQPQQKQQPRGNRIHPQTDLNNVQSYPYSGSNNDTNTNPTQHADPPCYSALIDFPSYEPSGIQSRPSDFSSDQGNPPPPPISSYPSPPSPPLPPPPTPPPIIDNIQDPYVESPSPTSSAPSSRPTSSYNPYERAGAITPAPSSDATMYEPIPLDITSFPSSPSSPTPSSSSSAQTSNNIPLSPGGVSELSNEGMSLPSSPDRLSYSSDTGAPTSNNNHNINSSDNRHSVPHQREDMDREIPPATTSLSTPAQGHTTSTNPFLPQDSDYSNNVLSLDNKSKPSEPSGDDATRDGGRNNGDVSMMSLKEADNDVVSRRGRTNDGNVYVNVDNIGGKETTF